MRVLLVYSNPARDLLPAPPVGLAYVASAARRAGHDVRVVDLIDSDHPDADLRAELGRVAPDAVGFSIRNIDNVVRQRSAWHLQDAANLAGVARLSSAAPIVLGGPAVSVLGPAVFRRVDGDIAVVGEGEDTFVRVLSALEAGESPAGLPGVHVRARGDIVAGPPARLPAFGASGLEDWIDWRPYERLGSTWPIQTKRGCALTCSYCVYPTLEGEATRRRPPADVADEIERVQRRVGPRTFEFVDSTFNVPPAHAAALCDEIIRRRLRVRLTAMGVNPLGVSPGLFATMRRAGFTAMMVTPEAASETMLRSLRKGFGVERVRETAQLARASGIASMWFFMLGGPGETRQTIEETVSFVERHLDWPGAVAVFMTGIRVLPGTRLARDAVRDGELARDADLSAPTFYLSPAVDEDWMLRRINDALGRCPGIVHAAEEGASTYERVVHRLLSALGVAPPYWRFLPLLLRVPPVPALRRRRPPLTPARGG
jgi:radical SAM superfamily enzyme YgiQ (UPF0313 family)